MCVKQTARTDVGLSVSEQYLLCSDRPWDCGLSDAVEFHGDTRSDVCAVNLMCELTHLLLIQSKWQSIAKLRNLI